MSQVTQIRLRVVLSRDLTWSERETFRERSTMDREDAAIYKLEWVKPAREFLLTVDAPKGYELTFDSRDVAWALHEDLANEYFNVHLVSVRTLSPKVRL